MEPDELLDDSERDFIRRAIEAAGKDSSDAATIKDYTRAYIDLRRRLRFGEWTPPSGTKEN